MIRKCQSFFNARLVRSILFSNKADEEEWWMPRIVMSLQYKLYYYYFYCHPIAIPTMIIYSRPSCVCLWKMNCLWSLHIITESWTSFLVDRQEKVENVKNSQMYNTVNRRLSVRSTNVVVNHWYSTIPYLYVTYSLRVVHSTASNANKKQQDHHHNFFINQHVEMLAKSSKWPKHDGAMATRPLEPRYQTQ